MGGHFTVVWTPELRRDVAARWLRADRSDRVRLTAASDRLDRELRFAPVQRGITLMHLPGFRLWSIQIWTRPFWRCMRFAKAIGSSLFINFLVSVCE
jgi:hypothetical protein